MSGRSIIDRIFGRNAPPSVAESAPPRPTAGYLRDTKAGIIRTRPAVLRESRDDIRAAWTRSAGIAVDLIQNSGRLKGAVDQVLADTVGSLTSRGWATTKRRRGPSSPMSRSAGKDGPGTRANATCAAS
jgi:hypothetical protein